MADRKVDSDLTPGELLRRSRQRVGWSIEEVADELNLLPAVVESIENDNYSEMAGWTYVVGYLRSYAKLVGISIDEAILTHKTLLPQKEDAPGTLTHRSGSRLSIPISLSWIVTAAVVIVVFGGLIATYWQRSIQEDRVLVDTRPRSELSKSNPTQDIPKTDVEENQKKGETSTFVKATGNAMIEPQEMAVTTIQTSDVDDTSTPIQLKIMREEDLPKKLENASEVAEVKRIDRALTIIDFDTRIIGLDLVRDNNIDQPDSN
ncbi:MAG: hypothetical protein CL402_04400 [Acidiferrobacteraceae bacterium]|nr:hypothetical protein [Acidiferrobacteraceae bacterium]|tara:strand:+ start:16568 stop:17353 length:786 start_codon:yes stop_codon:yes gene_type:complete